jgi:response regulator RpfG family c-di-GMP phosphodiesterase
VATLRADSPLLLIVDDEMRILAALRRCLRREGYQIITADSPRKAIRILEDQPVDLILSDHQMPGMTGMELLSLAAEQRPEAARVLITGWTESVTPEALRAADVRAMIPKPWDDAELKRILRSALESR